MHLIRLAAAVYLPPPFFMSLENTETTDMETAAEAAKQKSIAVCAVPLPEKAAELSRLPKTA